MKQQWVALSAAMIAVGCTAQPPRVQYASNVVISSPTRIAIVGDLQRTSAWEFWREQNDRERELVVQHIAAGNPSLLVLLGDLVFDGSSSSDWSRFDELMRPVRDRSIPVISAVGNHDYLWGGRSNLPQMFGRFPLMRSNTYGWMTIGALGLVLLDSNRERLGEEVWDVQRAWFRQTLATLDADPQVRGVIVALHHPPISNSTVTGDEPEVQAAFLPAFGASRKTLAMVSGHVHAYERFEYRGKQLVVSGGGGGPRVTLLQGTKQRHADLYSGGSPRPFHVLWMTLLADGVELSVQGIDKGGSDFGCLETLMLRYR